jgi:hypothetical protein
MDEFSAKHGHSATKLIVDRVSIWDLVKHDGTEEIPAMAINGEYSDNGITRFFNTITTDLVLEIDDISNQGKIYLSDESGQKELLHL